MNHPLVSICIPVRNRPGMLREALLSAMSQTYEMLEITVVDNASTDETADVARDLARQDERISVYVNERDIGGMNYSRTLTRSRGELVKFLNSDDMMEPTCIEQLVKAIDHPGVALSFCPAKYIDENGSSLPTPRYDQLLGLDHDATLDGSDLADRMLTSNANLIGVPTQALWRRSALNGTPMGFGERVWQILGDVALWLSILTRGDAAYVHEPLTIQRRHGGQHQATSDFMIRAAFDWLEISNVAARYGFLRRPTSQSAATTVAMRQLAWRIEPDHHQSRQILEGVRIACERLRMHHGEPPGMGTFLGLQTFLFVERGDGSDVRRVIREFLSAFPNRSDVRLVIAAESSKLASVSSILEEFREDVTSPLSLLLVEDTPVSGVTRLRGPVLSVNSSVTHGDFEEALSWSSDAELDKPWTDLHEGPRSMPKLKKLQSIRWLAAELGLTPASSFNADSFSEDDA
jgi:Glycosyl transferase family 2